MRNQIAKTDSLITDMNEPAPTIDDYYRVVLTVLKAKHGQKYKDSAARRRREEDSSIQDITTTTSAKSILYSPSSHKSAQVSTRTLITIITSDLISQLTAMPTFTVFKGNESGVPKKETTTKPDELTGDEVFVRITASGVCGTDLHHRHMHMGLGHEGVGVVEKIGPDCKTLKLGDRVGWGYNHNFCGHCEQCLSGNDIYCVERAMYGSADLDQGSFGSHAVWREKALFKIPRQHNHSFPPQLERVSQRL
ncbi:hypothetical protein O1611_g423 [Lasiodiplodia mahajangana]|uniref:Uncharacterized protein n=1 Tax=Lasiodiplodia mahajangana TaxID=1108764 RepID=A0ACC2K088_9PEZI|nr:hypothetical protein O1611_g423 [Lasiodiplodia mahajangana]